MYDIEQISDINRHIVINQIAESWAGPFVVSRGVLHDTRLLPGFVAEENDEILGYILYNIAGNDCEIVVLESLHEKRGIGGALVKAVIEIAENAGCIRVWLITTNDNSHAMRFYQRIGFSIRALHVNAIEESRKLKTQIPIAGFDGIPILHELEFEWSVIK